MNSSMELSLYPIRSNNSSDIIENFIENLEAFNVHVQPGPMSTLLIGETEELFRAVQSSYEKAVTMGGIALVIKISNVCPVSYPKS